MSPHRRILQNIGLIAVLKALQNGRMSGWELITALTGSTEGGDVLPAGHCEIYALLYLLESKGLVVGLWEGITPGRGRRYYALTARGRRRLARHGASWRSVGRSLAAFGNLLGASSAEYVWKGVRA